MKTRSLILTTAACALMATAGFAQTAAPKIAGTKTAATGKAAESKPSVTHGAITSIDADQVVVSEKGKDGKTSSRTFMIDKETSKAGNLAVGNDVTVHYRSEKDHMMATSIVGKAGKAKVAAKTSAKK